MPSVLGARFALVAWAERLSDVLMDLAGLA